MLVASGVEEYQKQRLTEKPEKPAGSSEVMVGQNLVLGGSCNKLVFTCSSVFHFFLIIILMCTRFPLQRQRSGFWGLGLLVCHRCMACHVIDDRGGVGRSAWSLFALVVHDCMGGSHAKSAPLLQFPKGTYKTINPGPRTFNILTLNPIVLETTYLVHACREPQYHWEVSSSCPSKRV